MGIKIPLFQQSKKSWRWNTNTFDPGVPIGLAQLNSHKNQLSSLPTSPFFFFLQQVSSQHLHDLDMHTAQPMHENITAKKKSM
jgi:hypothetical protein